MTFVTLIPEAPGGQTMFNWRQRTAQRETAVEERRQRTILQSNELFWRVLFGFESFQVADG